LGDQGAIRNERGGDGEEVLVVEEEGRDVINASEKRGNLLRELM